MEMQEYNCCYEPKKKCKKTNCLEIIAIIFSILFVSAIGIIAGTLAAEFFLSYIASVVVLTIVFGILLVLTILLLFCKKSKDKH